LFTFEFIENLVYLIVGGHRLPVTVDLRLMLSPPYWSYASTNT